MNNLNQRENPMLYWFSKIGDLCALSAVWILLCLPVLTIIPACISLFDSVAHCIHGTEEGPVRRFFRTLKSELLRGIGLSAVCLIVGYGLFCGYNILYQMSKENPALAGYALVYLFSLLIPISVLVWLVPVESRFAHSFLGLFRASAVYAICHLPTTLILLAILAIAILLVLMIPILALLVPAIAATVQCWLIERVFAKYIPQEDKADD